MITGASDDDPSGIATYSQAGAQFGYGMLWTMLFSYPLMTAIQEAAARIGCVTGAGLAGNLRAQYPRWLAFSLVLLLVAANTINIGADLAAMGAAAQLLIGHGAVLAYAAAFAIVSVVLEVFVSYRRYARIMMILTASLLAYVASIIVVRVDWVEAARATALPPIRFDAEYLVMIVAVLGTTISPYLFFWQASQEVEEQQADRVLPLRTSPADAPAELSRIKTDTFVGMAASNVIAFCIILVAAATLHRSGITEIRTAADAAAALGPIAGRFASVVFAIGIIGTGLLSVPVLAGSGAYAVGEALHATIGLDRKPHEAKLFYVVITMATVVGFALDLAGVDPMRALIYAAVINGVVAVPVMGMLLVMGSAPRVMGTFVLPRRIRVIGWVATAIMVLAVAGMILALVV